MTRNREFGVLRVGPRITIAPVVHGSGDCAVAVRQLMLDHEFDCLAVPLPASFAEDVLAGVEHLPSPTIAVQRSLGLQATPWSPTSENEDHDAAAEQDACSYVPIDPCQPVIAAIRTALGEHMPLRFIDLETDRFLPESMYLPDPYALKRVSLEKFAAATLPALPRPRREQTKQRIQHMARVLREMQLEFKSILFVCALNEWPYVREAILEGTSEPMEHDHVADVELCQTDIESLFFLLGEIPFITSLYEQSRAELSADENLSVDGVKELLIESRQAYRREYGSRALTIPPQALSICLRYIRNLTLINGRLTPDLFSIVTAAQQVVGDGYALEVIETAKTYSRWQPNTLPELKMGVGRARLPSEDIVDVVSRLPGPPMDWCHLELQRKPPKQDRKNWQMQWNPFAQCSWPPEDKLIEDFRAHVVDRAKSMLGADLARTEKFTTSVKDGIDIRDTLRNWHTGDIYVKELPPSHDRLDAAVMLFDSPADPRDYPWRTSWYAEHQNESTLAFFASDYRQEMIGPGIGMAVYGGAMFLFPPIAVPDIWHDPRLDFTETLEERLLASACMHSQGRQIALLSSLPPGQGWRRLARRFNKTWVHIPLAQFGQSTIQKMRMVHVLNGKDVRSYAAHFIRRP